MKSETIRSGKQLNQTDRFFISGTLVLLLIFGLCPYLRAQSTGSLKFRKSPESIQEKTVELSEQETPPSTLASENQIARDMPVKKSDEKSDSTSSSKRSVGDVFQEYQQKLEELAKKCESLDMPLEAKVTRSLIYPDSSEMFTVPLLPKEESLKGLPEDASKNQRFWYSALLKLRNQYSDELYSYAERFGKKKRGYDVVACVVNTLFVNPDHAKARQFFGYKLQDGFWLDKWELRQLENGFVETPEFGWIPSGDVERYKKGERFYKNKWISKEDETKKIIASASGWRVETEHFSILSRVSLERGVEISRFLEAYYEAWSRLFFRVIASENQWNSRLYSDADIVSKRHKVILYRNREEYLRELKKHDSNVTLSVGGYFPALRCIFVYEPDGNDEFDLLSLLAHETTHQLFEECSTSVQSRFKIDFNSRAQNANFWAIEGIAVYAETFKVNKSRTTATLGGHKGVFRIQCALESLFEDEDYVPLREYAGLSRDAFQSRRDVPLLYSQAAGLTFFFMHYDKGKYRDAFVTYLYEVYQGKDSRDSLEQATGKTFEELDQEYVAFMRSLYQPQDNPFNIPQKEQ